MATRHDYSRQAGRYDSTRAASPSVLGPLRDALAGVPGPVLIDVGGGTGNYAAALRSAGVAPTVSDLSDAMLRVARSKDLPVVRADAGDLPFATGAADAVILISMLHHVPRLGRRAGRGPPAAPARRPPRCCWPSVASTSRSTG